MAMGFEEAQRVKDKDKESKTHTGDVESLARLGFHPLVVEPVLAHEERSIFELRSRHGDLRGGDSGGGVVQGWNMSDRRDER